MKTAGLIGGVAWPSTLLYYRLLNEHVQRALGGLHSARCVISSLDFAPVYAEMVIGDRAAVTRRMEEAAHQVRVAGAELVAILSNTGHFAADEVATAAGVPLVHLVRETAASIRAAHPHMRRLGLLATGFAVAAPFFGRWLSEHAGFELLLPDAEQQRQLDAAIFGPLAHGEATPDTVADTNELCASLQARGAEGVLLGCTELSPLAARLQPACAVFDSTEIHVRAIVRAMTLP
ncbi:MAG: amino acid racemase [Acidovorax sp.]|uniref:aspartate/glutamate racemase family protein n=1 Tax=Acidovorax sp. TaxID=1872122 RepID=UPI0022BA919D|nr:amino acid racemase [Acidovorax sp.]MCZ8218869.1 amino acid racemase [Acidovorax sp.]